MTPSRCFSFASGFILSGLTAFLVSGSAACRSAEFAAGVIGASPGARPGPCFQSCRSPRLSLACVAQRLVMVQL